MRGPWRNTGGGFTLIELLAILAVTATMTGMAVISMQGALTDARGNTAAYQVASLLRYGRDAATAQRRSVDVVFMAPNRIQLLRNDLPDGTTIIASAALENGARFEVDASLPDTPDAFGNKTAVAFDGVDIVRFMPDGTLTDGAGIPLNGTVFIGLPQGVLGARAVTITGTTARAQPYRWTGARWESL